ncbi:MAG: Phosphatidylserine decarboxylase proenzyme [Myxococcota bacterium]|nr:Phosphatidylserine decarboxylase proenzyme [Myxococcota bacterium]
MNRFQFQLVNLLPKNELSQLVGWAARNQAPAPVVHYAIRQMIKRFQIDTSEFDAPIESFASINDFFVRELRPGARPVDAAPDSVVSPVDARLTERGEIRSGAAVQTKGREYSIADLLDDAQEAALFEGGTFLTFYLAPPDYHRIHMPLEGRVTAFRHVHGALYPVNEISVESVDRLFAVNERLITWLDTPAGKAALVMIGATCVGRIRVVYNELATNSGAGPVGLQPVRDYPPLAKGAELGRFELGSSVVLLFQKGRFELDQLPPRARVRMGQKIGVFL